MEVPTVSKRVPGRRSAQSRCPLGSCLQPTLRTRPLAMPFLSALRGSGAYSSWAFYRSRTFTTSASNS